MVSYQVQGSKNCDVQIAEFNIQILDYVFI